MAKNEHVKVEIDIGDGMRDYRVGDYLSALDELTCYFESQCDCLRPEMAQALKLYADKVENSWMTEH